MTNMTIYEEDLLNIAQKINEYGYKNNVIMVSGATGMIGSLLVNGFVKANELYGLNNTIYALVRNQTKALKMFSYANPAYLSIIENDITQPIFPSVNIDYFFHTACVTNSKEISAKPVELIATSVFGTYNVLNYCLKNNAKSVVCLSSIEAFGEVKNQSLLSENDLGRLDLTKTRSCYPASKRLNENMVKCFSAEYGLNCINARLAQTFGAGVDPNDSRVFAYIAKNIIEGKDIEFKTSGESAHDYCYSTDCITALLLLALKGKAGETYNVSNPDTYSSVFNMAKLVAEKLGERNIKIIKGSSDELPQFPSASFVHLDISKITQLGWQPKYNLIDMYDRLIKYYKELDGVNHGKDKNQ